MTQINAYLTFNNNTEEAMTFYQQCLGGELQVMKVGDTPVCDQMPAGSENQVMHANLKSGSIILMASDCMGHELEVGNNVSLSLNCSSEEEINDFFNKLSEGGKVVMPVGPQFWGALFGACVDKYGINWLFNYELPKGE